MALTLAAAEAWRTWRQQTIEEGLARANTRLAADLAAALEVLRDSAAELLGLDLAVPDPGGRLAEDRRFFYTTDEEAGQTEQLAGVIRRTLPGELGRRSAREHLRRELPGLVTPRPPMRPTRNANSRSGRLPYVTRSPYSATRVRSATGGPRRPRRTYRMLEVAA